MTSLIIGIITGIISVILGVWKIASIVHKRRETHEHIAMHLDTGDRFSDLGEFRQAIVEYQKVIDLDKTHVEAHRRIISANKEMLQRKAFIGDRWYGIELGKKFSEFRKVNDEEINDALNVIYKLQAINPNDLDLLLDEAGIMKTGGKRAKDGVKLLTKALDLDPNNPVALAELGILLASISDDQTEVQKGLDFIRRAIEIKPEEARYHYYLGSALRESSKCIDTKTQNGNVDTSDANAEAIREFHQATLFASGDDDWSKLIHRDAPLEALSIFRSYVNSESTILSPHLNMSLDERIRQIEFFRQNKARLTGGTTSEINSLFWLTTLYHAVNDSKTAEKCLRQLIKEECQDYIPSEWLPMFLEVMEANDSQDEIFDRVKALADKNVKETRV